MLNRRQLLKTTGAAVVAANTTKASEPEPTEIVDTNVSLHRWPFRRLPLDKTKLLVQKLSGLNVVEAWASSFEGLLHRDFRGLNARLLEDCSQHPMLKPVGVINPILPDWREDLRQCRVEFGMHAIRLFPNYHGYKLSDPEFAEALHAAQQHRLLVQLPSTIEDVRTQNAVFNAPDVDLSPLAEVISKQPRARVQILNLRPRAAELKSLEAVPQIYFDTSRADATDGVAELLQQVGDERVMMGSHAPFLIPEAAVIRVHESGRLTESQLRAVYSKNALAISEVQA